LEMCRSRTVLLLPLSVPGEHRRSFNLAREADVNVTDDDEDSEESEKIQRVRAHVRKQLSKFRDASVASSQNINYRNFHSLIGLSGCIGYALGIADKLPSPVSPSAWLVVSALQSAGIAMNVDERSAMSAKCEDFLRDHRFYETNTIGLRPGWKFLPPLALRETSRSL